MKTNISSVNSSILIDFPGSSVSGTIHNNTFEGVILLDARTQLFVENGVKYFGPSFCRENHFCYIIYNGKTTDLFK